MTADPQNEPQDEGYYAEIEDHFVQRRGSPLFITPAEWELVWRWEQQGIPLSVVKAGIDRVFERAKTTHKLRKLGYCRQTVEAEFRRYREAKAGAHDEGSGDGDDVVAGIPAEAAKKDTQSILRSLAASVEAFDLTQTEILDKGRVEGAIRETAASLRELASGSEARGPDALEQELFSLEERLLLALEDSLTTAVRSAVLADAEASLDSYRERMPEKVYRSALRSSFRRRIRSGLGIVRLTLWQA